MTYIQTIQNEAALRTSRLRNPSNAVPDFGIDLSRKSIPKVIPVVRIDAAAQAVVVTEYKRRRLPPYIIKRKYPLIADITDCICAHFGVTWAEIQSPSRRVKVSHPRQVCCYLTRILTPMSLSDIANMIGNRDHTTILHATRKIEKLVGVDPKVCADVDIVKHEIHKRFVLRNNFYCFDEREL